MTTTFHTSGAHIATTRTGGRIVYQADGIQLIDAIAAFVVFFIVLLWGAIITGGGEWLSMEALPAPRPQRSATWRKSGAGKIWVRAYGRGVWELVRGAR